VLKDLSGISRKPWSNADIDISSLLNTNSYDIAIACDVRFSPDLTAGLWLRDFVPDPENFNWDDGNRHKSLKHGLSCKEVESLFLQEHYIFAGRIIEPTHEEWRGLILGQSESGRAIALIFTRRGEMLRPISCRPMREGERRFYAASIHPKE
jgi:uncharacterized DUF497 family protein